MTRTEDGICFWLTVGLHRTHKQHLDKWMVAGKGHGASGQYAPHPLVHKVSHLCRQRWAIVLLISHWLVYCWTTTKQILKPTLKASVCFRICCVEARVFLLKISTIIWTSRGCFFAAKNVIPGQKRCWRQTYWMVCGPLLRAQRWCSGSGHWGQDNPGLYKTKNL